MLNTAVKQLQDVAKQHEDILVEALRQRKRLKEIDILPQDRDMEQVWNKLLNYYNREEILLETNKESVVDSQIRAARQTLAYANELISSRPFY